MGAIVRIVDVVKNYHLEGGTVRALRGVSLSVDEGDFVALMGPSGSGKSTLLNVLGCLDRPTSGEYYLGDEEVARMPDDQLSEIRSLYLGFIFQSYNLLPQYTLVENIEVPLLYQGRQLGRETRERCIELAGLVGLGDRHALARLSTPDLPIIRNQCDALPLIAAVDRLVLVRGGLPRHARVDAVPRQGPADPGAGVAQPLAAQGADHAFDPRHHHRHF